MERRGSEPLVEHSVTLQSPNHGADVLLKLNDLRGSGCLTDAVLCVGEEELACHRNVLAVSSPYFRAMFSCDLRESRQLKITFNEVSAWTLGRLIDYAYTGSIEITVDNAQDTLTAASLFQYPDIVNACCDFLARHLHPSNCLGIEEFAHLHSCAKLETEAHCFTLENFSCVAEQDEFLELSEARLVTYLSSDLIDVRSEENVFEAMMRWTDHDPAHRSHHLCSILKHVRFGTMDSRYIDEVVNKHHLLGSSERRLVSEACLSRPPQGQRRRSSIHTDTPRPSTLAKQVLVLVGGLNSVNYVTQSVEMYEPHKDKWSSLPEMPQALSWFSMVALHNYIYVLGGILEGHIVSTVWRFDPVRRCWEAMPKMLGGRARHSACVWNDQVYVVGGINLVGDSKIVAVEDIECYDVSTAQWSLVGQSPLPRKQSQLVAYEETLVELGGTQNGAQTRTMESYVCTPSSVRYSGEQFILPECIQFSQIVNINSIFYIIWEDSKKVISLNPSKRTFRRLPDLHYTHIHSGASVLDDKIYVAGGLIDSKPSRITECYDPSTDCWTVTKSMGHARACHRAVTIQMS